MKLILAALAFTTVLAGPALADDAPAGVEKMATDDCARARKAGKVCELTIEDEEIKGNVPGAGEMNVGILRFVTSTSLIRVRKDFIPEILKTAEDL